MSETQINELKRDLKYKGEIIKSLTESNNNLIVNQEIIALAIKELQERLAKIENAIKDKECRKWRGLNGEYDSKNVQWLQNKGVRYEYW